MYIHEAVRKALLSGKYISRESMNKYGIKIEPTDTPELAMANENKNSTVNVVFTADSSEYVKAIDEAVEKTNQLKQALEAVIALIDSFNTGGSKS